MLGDPILQVLEVLLNCSVMGTERLGWMEYETTSEHVMLGLGVAPRLFGILSGHVKQSSRPLREHGLAFTWTLDSFSTRRFRAVHLTHKKLNF